MPPDHPKAPSAAGSYEPLHPNHLPDLRYTLMVLEKVRDLLLPTLPKEDAAQGEVRAAIVGMRYVIERTEQAQRKAGAEVQRCKPGTRCSRSIRGLGGCEAGSCEREEGAVGVNLPDGAKNG